MRCQNLARILGAFFLALSLILFTINAVDGFPALSRNYSINRSISIPNDNRSLTRQGRQVMLINTMGLINRLFEKAEWDVLFVKMTRLIMEYFMKLSLKEMFGSDGSKRSLDNNDRLLSLPDTWKTNVKNLISSLLVRDNSYNNRLKRSTGDINTYPSSKTFGGRSLIECDESRNPVLCLVETMLERYAKRTPRDTRQKSDSKIEING